MIDAALAADRVEPVWPPEPCTTTLRSPHALPGDQNHITGGGTARLRTCMALDHKLTPPAGSRPKSHILQTRAQHAHPAHPAHPARRQGSPPRAPAHKHTPVNPAMAQDAHATSVAPWPGPTATTQPVAASACTARGARVSIHTGAVLLPQQQHGRPSVHYCFGHSYSVRW